MKKHSCVICKKEMGYFESKANATDYEGPKLPGGLTKDDKICSMCLDNEELKKKESNTDKYLRTFAPEWKYVLDSKERGQEIKCKSCGKVLPKHSLTCMAKQFANPFGMMKYGAELSKEASEAYCSKCHGFLPEHKDGCPLKSE